MGTTVPICLTAASWRVILDDLETLFARLEDGGA
jgi:hypothetical protein